MNTQEKKLEALLKKAIIYKSMKNVTVYMGPMCAFCDAAKRLLVRNNIPYKEINIALKEDKMNEMLSKSNGKLKLKKDLSFKYWVGSGFTIFVHFRNSRVQS